MTFTDADLDAWQTIEESHARHVDTAVLVELAARAHRAHIVELERAERALCSAVRRAQRSRRQAARAGRLLESALHLFAQARERKP